MTVIAFHGKPGGAAMLRRDMGDPDWVDHYFSGHDLVDAYSLVESNQGSILVGYSYGGDLIGRLTNVCTTIIGAVLYEAPLFEPTIPLDDFPVLQVWNRYGRESWGDSQRAKKFWDGPFREVVEMRGRGFHVRLTWRWPFLGHAWDRDLNGEIKKFVSYCRNRHAKDQQEATEETS